MKSLSPLMPVLFLAVAALAGCATATSQPPESEAAATVSTTPIVHVLPPLPYSVTALAPAIDAPTMEIHHGRHHRAYVDNLNKALKGTIWAAIPLELLLQDASKLPSAIRNNGGGHFNHSLFWTLMTPDADQRKRSEKLNAAILAQFGTIESFQKQFEEAALGRFGSGWAWLIRDSAGKLAITTTPNQDNPLMDVAERRGQPLLALDVWEHAYYLKYQNKRADYAKAFWSVVNWMEVSRRYEEASKQSASP